MGRGFSLGTLAGIRRLAVGNTYGAPIVIKKITGGRSIPAADCRPSERVGTADHLAPAPKFWSTPEHMDADRIWRADPGFAPEPRPGISTPV